MMMLSRMKQRSGTKGMHQEALKILTFVQVQIKAVIITTRPWMLMLLMISKRMKKNNQMTGSSMRNWLDLRNWLGLRLLTKKQVLNEAKAQAVL